MATTPCTRLQGHLGRRIESEPTRRDAVIILRIQDKWLDQITRLASHSRQCRRCGICAILNTGCGTEAQRGIEINWRCWLAANEPRKIAAKSVGTSRVRTGGTFDAATWTQSGGRSVKSLALNIEFGIPQSRFGCLECKTALPGVARHTLLKGRHPQRHQAKNSQDNQEDQADHQRNSPFAHAVGCHRTAGNLGEIFYHGGMA